jgi:hypothetical protein
VSADAWRLVQDGNRSLIIEGHVALPRVVGVKASALIDQLATRAPVLYTGEPVGRVEDAELTGEDEAFVAAELGKAARYYQRVADLVRRQALGARVLPERARSVVDLVHRPTYRVLGADARGLIDLYRRAGLEISPAAMKALSEAEDIENQAELRAIAADVQARLADIRSERRWGEWRGAR